MCVHLSRERHILAIHTTSSVLTRHRRPDRSNIDPLCVSEPSCNRRYQLRLQSRGLLDADGSGALRPLSREFKNACRFPCRFPPCRRANFCTSWLLGGGAVELPPTPPTPDNHVAPFRTTSFCHALCPICGGEDVIGLSRIAWCTEGDGGTPSVRFLTDAPACVLHMTDTL